MRAATWGMVAAGVLSLAAFGLHNRYRLDDPGIALSPDVPVLARSIGADAISTWERSFGVIAYRVPLPSATSSGGTVEVRFREPLDGARVEAVANGPQMHATLLRKRIGGDTVVVPLPLGTVDAIEVLVHRNFRPPPIVRDIGLLTPATPAAATADPPPATSPRSMR
jgi:hypothetical protein